MSVRHYTAGGGPTSGLTQPQVDARIDAKSEPAIKSYATVAAADAAHSLPVPAGEAYVALLDDGTVIRAAAGSNAFTPVAGATLPTGTVVDVTPGVVPADLAALEVAAPAVGQPAGQVWQSLYGPAPHQLAQVVGGVWAEVSPTTATTPNNWVHADATTVAAADAANPTLAEMQAFVTAQATVDAPVYYTGTDNPADPVTFSYWADGAGVVRPSGSSDATGLIRTDVVNDAGLNAHIGAPDLGLYNVTSNERVYLKVAGRFERIDNTSLGNWMNILAADSGTISGAIGAYDVIETRVGITHPVAATSWAGGQVRIRNSTTSALTVAGGPVVDNTGATITSIPAGAMLLSVNDGTTLRGVLIATAATATGPGFIPVADTAERVALTTQVDQTIVKQADDSSVWVWEAATTQWVNLVPAVVVQANYEPATGYVTGVFAISAIPTGSANGAAGTLARYEWTGPDGTSGGGTTAAMDLAEETSGNWTFRGAAADLYSGLADTDVSGLQDGDAMFWNAGLSMWMPGQAERYWGIATDFATILGLPATAGDEVFNADTGNTLKLQGDGDPTVSSNWEVTGTDDHPEPTFIAHNTFNTDPTFVAK